MYVLLRETYYGNKSIHIELIFILGGQFFLHWTLRCASVLPGSRHIKFHFIMLLDVQPISLILCHQNHKDFLKLNEKCQIPFFIFNVSSFPFTSYIAYYYYYMALFNLASLCPLHTEVSHRIETNPNRNIT